MVVKKQQLSLWCAPVQAPSRCRAHASSRPRVGSSISSVSPSTESHAAMLTLLGIPPLSLQGSMSVFSKAQLAQSGRFSPIFAKQSGIILTPRCSKKGGHPEKQRTFPPPSTFALIRNKPSPLLHRSSVVFPAPEGAIIAHAPSLRLKGQAIDYFNCIKRYAQILQYHTFCFS